MLLRSTILLFTCSQVFAQVGPPTAEMRENFKLGKHYEKVRMVDDFPVVSSAKVPDAALEEAAHVVRAMLVNRTDIIRKLAENRIRLGIMAVCERTCDLPEHATLTPSAYWNRRARGLGASREHPCVSCGEENLLHNPGDPYSTESIMVHEFAHAIHLMAVNDLDDTFDQRLKAAYESAMKKGLWKGFYAADNHREYWAEAVQSWFDTNRENDALHNHVNTRQELIDYDPALAALCREVFGDNEWRYVRADDPSRKNEPHLKDLDRSKLRPFAWKAEEQAAYDALGSHEGEITPGLAFLETDGLLLQRSGELTHRHAGSLAVGSLAQMDFVAGDESVPVAILTGKTSDAFQLDHFAEIDGD